MNSEIMTSATVRFINSLYRGTIWLGVKAKHFSKSNLVTMPTTCPSSTTG